MLSSPDMARLFGEIGAGTCPGLAQTFDRRFINGTLTPATGTLYLSAILLPAGMAINNVVLYTGATGVTTNTHNWAALYALDPSTSVLKTLGANTVDDTSGTDYAANTKVVKTFSSPQVTTYTGLHYIGWMQAATTPALIAAAVAPAASIANGDTPIPSASSTTGLTTVAPTPAGALTAIIQSFYAYVT